MRNSSEVHEKTDERHCKSGTANSLSTRRATSTNLQKARIYVTLGVFLLLAVRDPASNRSLIAFAGWANLAHAGVMGVQECWNVIERRELAGVVVFAIVGIVLVALTPAKEAAEKESPVLD